MLDDDDRGDVPLKDAMKKESEDSKHHGNEEQDSALLKVAPDSVNVGVD